MIEGATRRPAADGSEPLEKRRWEAFCAEATGWAGADPQSATDAYLAAFPRTASRRAARANAARLAARPEVRARLAWMTENLAHRAGMDAEALKARITAARVEIFEKTKNTCHKKLALEAMRDLDRSLGLAAPEKRDVTVRAGGAAAESVARNVEALATALAARAAADAAAEGAAT
jgi:hypothetical protein